MQIVELSIENFRGFSNLVIRPNGHVVVVGERGAGRTDIVQSLSRILDTDAARSRISQEADFHKLDTSQPIIISVTLVNLGSRLEQLFFDYLDAWDPRTRQVVPSNVSLSNLTTSAHEWALRLTYRALWVPAEERAEEFVYYPSASDHSNSSFVHARRRDIEQLGFLHLGWSGGRIFDLASRGTLRQIIEGLPQTDFATAVDQYIQSLGSAATNFSASTQVNLAVDQTITPLRDLLALPTSAQFVQFVPEGGAASGLLRSLGPALDFQDGMGPIPAWRRGSTIGSLLRIAETLALASKDNPIIAIDDLGDGLDPSSAIHMAGVLQGHPGQSWITTRLASVPEIFEPENVVRLGLDTTGGRTVNQVMPVSTKIDRIAVKHWHRNLLPALSFRSALIVEGPDDFAAFHTVAGKLHREQTYPLPATFGATLLSAAASGSGGYSSVVRLSAAAKTLGLRAIGIIDGDTTIDQVNFLASHGADADLILRLPDGIEIEEALIEGLSDETIRSALSDAFGSAGVTPPPTLTASSAATLKTLAVSQIKSHSLHARFVDALDFTVNQPPIVDVYKRALSEIRTQITGLIQL